MIKLGIGQSFCDHITIFRLRIERPVWRIGCEIAQKRFIRCYGLLYECLCFSKKHIRTVTRKLFFCAVVNIDVIKIVVAPIAWNRGNGRGGIPHALLKSTVLRTKWIVRAEMPFTKYSRGIPRVAKVIGDRRDFRTQ